MDSFKPIYWHQGLFLKPHHFQYLYAKVQEENNKLRQSIQSFFFGVANLKIDEKELLNKNIVIELLELIFMDGSIVKLPNNALISTRFLSEKYEDMDTKVKIYVGVKSFITNGVNVSEIDSTSNIEDINTRFVTNLEVNPVHNLYHKDEDAEVQFMDYCLKIFFEDEIENLNGYQILQVAEIEKQNEQVVLTDTFIPPLLDIKSNDTLFEMIKTMQKDLASHVMQLQEYKLPSSVLLEEPNYLKYLMALQSLSPFTIKLNHLLTLSNIHPIKYYELFLELIGVLSTFSSRVDIFGKLENGKSLIQEYNHFNLYSCFSEVKLLIKELLDVIIIGPDYIFSFIKNETTYTLDCPVSIFNAKYRYFLVLKTPTNKDEITKDFVDFAKIASSSEIETIVERSLIGLEFRVYDMPIQGLPQREDSTYYELFIDNEVWGHIQQTQNITIEFDEALENVSIELIVLKN